MTRETKVGLLIGLGLILFIGIIVSDHLSQGSQTEPSALIQAADRAHRSINDLPYANRTGQSVPRQTGDALPGQRSIPTPQEVDQLSQPGDGMIGSNRPPVAAAVDGQPADGGTKQRHTLLDPVGFERTTPMTTPTILPQPRGGSQIIHYVKDGESAWALSQKYLGDGRKWTLLRDHNPHALSSEGILADNARLVIPNQLTLDGQFGAGAFAENRAARRTKRITVKSGDTLSVLAHRHLGSSRLWPKLLAANRDLVNEPEDLREGMSIVIPALTTTPTRNTATATPTRQPAASGRTYVVQAGDNLTRIAGKKLGDTSLWDEIFQANKDRLQNPDDLRVGQKLRIPG